MTGRGLNLLPAQLGFRTGTAIAWNYALLYEFYLWWYLNDWVLCFCTFSILVFIYAIGLLHSALKSWSDLPMCLYVIPLCVTQWRKDDRCQTAVFRLWTILLHRLHDPIYYKLELNLKEKQIYECFNWSHTKLKYFWSISSLFIKNHSFHESVSDDEIWDVYEKRQYSICG